MSHRHKITVQRYNNNHNTQKNKNKTTEMKKKKITALLLSV